MLKTVGKWTVVGAVALSILGGVGGVGQEPIQVEAATKALPDNHTIQELKVEWRKDLSHGFLVHVGDRKGTLLLRVDQPKVERNIEWVNWSITKPKSVSFTMHTKINERPYLPPFYFDSGYFNNGGKRFADDATLRYGLMKFSDFSDPNYYAALSIYLPQKYNNDGTYWFGGNGYALNEDGQVKAYFFENVDVVEDSIKRVSNGGTFPLMNKVMWGKTELWKGQLGKVTIKKPSTLWKRLENGNLEKVRDLKIGDEYRVYRYIDERNGLYGVGAGMFVERNTSTVLYETPSKRNLRLVKIMHGER
ncbi:hypothetical protein MKZ20_21795 [Psychrobacillus sp. FSL K6-2684]|uniref:hypothetical protein n=1 Tax=unclassified Psychrobacillus TaxID=2636677 RepID=UPI0030FBAB42